MRLVFEKASDLKYSRRGYRAVLVSSHHDPGEEPERIVLAELHKGEWILPRRPRWEIQLLHVKQEWKYTDTLNEAKALIEQDLIAILTGALFGEALKGALKGAHGATP